MIYSIHAIKPIIATIILAFSGVVASCVVDTSYLKYASIDDATEDATGQHLWELDIGDREVELVTEKLEKTILTSLYCIRDNAGASYPGPEVLSYSQRRKRTKNIRILMTRALLPTIAAKEKRAEQVVRSSGCQRRIE